MTPPTMTPLRKAGILAVVAATVGLQLFIGTIESGPVGISAFALVVLAVLGSVGYLVVWARNRGDTPLRVVSTDLQRTDGPPKPEKPLWHDPHKKPLAVAAMVIGAAIVVVPNLWSVVRTVSTGPEGDPSMGWWSLLAVPFFAAATWLYYRYGPREGVVWQRARGGAVRVDLARQRRALPMFLVGIGVIFTGGWLANTVLSSASTLVFISSFVVGMGLILGWAFASRATGAEGSEAPGAPDPITHDHAGDRPGGMIPDPSSAGDLDAKRIGLFALAGIAMAGLLIGGIVFEDGVDIFRSGDGASVSTYGRTMEWQPLAEDSGSGDLSGVLGGPRQANIGPFDIPPSGEQLNVSVTVTSTLLGPSVSFQLEKAVQGDWELWHEGDGGLSFTETIETQGVQKWRLVIERSDAGVQDASFEWRWTAGMWVDPGQCVYRDGRLDEGKSGDGCPVTPA